MGQKFWFSATSRRKVKIEIFDDLTKISPNQALRVFSIFPGPSNADDNSSSFGSLNERAVSITCPQKNWNQKQNASFREISWDSVNISILTFRREVAENQKSQKIKISDPWGSKWKLSYDFSDFYDFLRFLGGL